MSLRGLVVLIALAMASLSPRPARAQVDKAAAEELFREGRRLAKEGKFAEACTKFEGSQALDPATGTLLNLADCYEKIGRSASAWAAFKEVAELSRVEGNAKRADLASERARALEPRLSRLTINVPAASRVPGLVVLRDGRPLPEAVYGLSMPLDPGKHELAATAPGYLRWSTTADLSADGAKVSVDVPPLQRPAEPAPAPPPAPPREEKAAPATTSVTPPATTEVPTISPPEPPAVAKPAPRGPLTAEEKAKARPADDAPPNRRKEASVFVIILGGGGLAAGGVLAYLARSTRDDALHYCPPTGCEPKGVELNAKADDLALGAKVSAAAGVAILAGGIVLYLTAPDTSKPGDRSATLSPTFGRDGFGLALSGTF
jgi:hypothetical protein